MNRKLRPHAGVTLLELMISVAIMTLLVGMLSSAMIVTTRGMATEASHDHGEQSEILEELAQNLRLAIKFTERTRTAVTFTVPDRNGDNEPDTIRYAWAGGAGAIEEDGAALTMSLNGGDPCVLTERAYAFDLSYLVTTISGSGGTDEGGTADELKVLMVVRRTDNLLSQEVLRTFMLDAWGYAVTLIGSEEPASAFDAAVADHDVLYLPDQFDKNKLQDKVTTAPIGLVNENRDMVDWLDLGEESFDSTNGASVFVDDNTHYLTRPFYPGLLPIMQEQESLLHSDRALAPGATLLASQPGEPTRVMLLAVETGGELYSGAPAPARRVSLPWGNNIEFGRLNEDGLKLLRRALQWAAEAEVPDVGDAPLFAQNEDPTSGDRALSLKASDWAVASFLPDLPDDALGWTITRFRFLAQRKGDPDRTLVLQIRRRAADGAPMDEILAQKFIFESDFPVTFDWVEVAFDGAAEIAPDEGACIAIGMLSGVDGGQVLYESENGQATPGIQFYEGTPGDWDDPDADEDLPCEVYGSVRTPPAT